ncbi:hypothetical protein [Vibrio sp. YYF0003]|uniref:hypothetical protein n=1 Tax=Vibrio sp. YYF0003 TaxID=3116646 RepID=UPI002E9CA6C8|nr:hypothetical protein [Vibrio sp. YYF0003]
MEPLTLAIIAALGKLSQEVISDTYSALKELLTRKFGTSSSLVSAVDELEKQPESKKKQAELDAHVKALNLSQEEEIKQAAEKLCQRCGIDTHISISINGEAKVQGVVGSTDVYIENMSFGSDKE